jgi:hypothetical protein
MSHPEQRAFEVTAANVAQVIYSARYHYNDEKGLQDGIQVVLETNLVPFEREVVLSPRDRIDFLVNNAIGVEVKIASISAEVMQRQLDRYALDSRINHLILVTNRSRHLNLPRTIQGKPLTCLFLLNNIF